MGEDPIFRALGDALRQDTDQAAEDRTEAQIPLTNAQFDNGIDKDRPAPEGIESSQVPEIFSASIDLTGISNLFTAQHVTDVGWPLDASIYDQVQYTLPQYGSYHADLP
jgi:hypothetical protein